MPYDARRLREIELGEADLPDRDAVVEIAAGMVETMVRGYPSPSSRQEERYRTQLRTLRALLARLDVTSEPPASLTAWLDRQPARTSPLLIRASAEQLLGAVIRAVDATADEPEPTQLEPALTGRWIESPNIPESDTRETAFKDAHKSAPPVAAPAQSSEGSVESRGGLAEADEHEGPRRGKLPGAVLGWIGEKVLLALVIAIVATVAAGLILNQTNGNSSTPPSGGFKSTSDSGAQVTLAQGVKTGKDYWFSVTLQGFPAGVRIAVSCRDNEYPQGFGAFVLKTNRYGAASNGHSPCHSPASGANWVVADGIGSNHVTWRPFTSQVLPYAETVGVDAHTWTDFTNAGGTQGPTIAKGQTLQVRCRATGFKVADGNVWWYQIASAPWNNNYYASADAFYNNGAKSGGLRGTPFLDPNVPVCDAGSP